MKQKLKILYLLTSPLSVNTFGIHQIRTLHEHGFEIYLVCGRGDLIPELFKYSTKIYINPYLRRRSSPFWDLISLIHLFLTILFIKPTILIYSTPKSALLGALASFLNRTPIRIYQVWGVRWQNFSGIKLRLMKSADFLTLKLSTNILIVSKSIAQFLNKQYMNKKMIVLGSGSTAGVDTKNFFIKQSILEPQHLFRIGYAGRVSNDKGISDLFNLFIKLNSQIPNLHLEIIGDLDLADRISNKLVDDIKSQSNIQWERNVSQEELAAKMRNWDVQIFLSRREGLGNVILEAGACGVPTFCWNIMGTKDAIPEFMQDFLIPYGDINLLEKSVVSYSKLPLTQGEKIRLANWYHKNFDRKMVLSNFIDFINGILKDYDESK